MIKSSSSGWHYEFNCLTMVETGELGKTTSVGCCIWHCSPRICPLPVKIGPVDFIFGEKHYHSIWPGASEVMTSFAVTYAARISREYTVTLRYSIIVQSFSLIPLTVFELRLSKLKTTTTTRTTTTTTTTAR